jgi:hypothetical protein
MDFAEEWGAGRYGFQIRLSVSQYAKACDCTGAGDIRLNVPTCRFCKCGAERLKKQIGRLRNPSKVEPLTKRFQHRIPTDAKFKSDYCVTRRTKQLAQLMYAHRGTHVPRSPKSPPQLIQNNRILNLEVLREQNDL